MQAQSNRYKIATIIAIIFHLVGITGLLVSEQFRTSSISFYHLLLMFGLICYTTGLSRGFIFFSIIIIISGFLVELIGVKTGKLFGDYSYGKGLGPKLWDIPIIIGFNWLIIIYGCGTIMNILFSKLIRSRNPGGRNFGQFKKTAIVLDGASLAFILDWIMEPVATKLDFWSWAGDGTIPVFNYICWFLISALLLIIFHLFSFDKQNKFAVNLLLIQAMFFLLLRNLL